MDLWNSRATNAERRPPAAFVQAHVPQQDDVTPVTRLSPAEDGHSRDEWTARRSIHFFASMRLPDEFSSSRDEDAFLDEEFPLGDGVADLGAEVSCPYCGESVEIALDPGSGAHQQYVEDCYVCCRPWLVSVTYLEDGSAEVHVDANDAD